MTFLTVFLSFTLILLQTNEATCHTQNQNEPHERLLVLLGSPLTADVSFINLPSSSDQVCSKPPNYPLPVRGAVGTALGGQALVCGGRGDEEVDYLHSCYIFNGNKWTTHESMEVNRGFAAATWTPGGWWVTGGRNLDGDLSSSEILSESGWVAGPPLPAAMDGHCAVQLGDNRTLLAGGYSNGNINSVYIYDWSVMEWVQGEDLMEGREFLSCTVIEQDGKVMAAGGYDGASTLSSTEVYDPASGTWEEGPELPQPSSGAGFVRSDGGAGEIILVGGGYNNDKVWVFGQEGWGEGQIAGVERGLYQGISIVVEETGLTCE